MKSNRCAIGVDLGGTKVALVLIDEQGQLLEEKQFPTDLSSGDEPFCQKIFNEINAFIKQAKMTPEAIGVGLAGQIDARSGTVYFAPNLQWHQVPLKQRMEAACGLPVILLNDVRAATWGEWLHGAAQGCDDFVCLFIGTGVGAGIVSCGKMIEGATNSAGELGHITLISGGRPCSCGHRGCFEAYVGGWGIAASLRQAVQQNKKGSKELLAMVEGERQRLTTYQLVAALKESNPLAKELFNDLVQLLADGCVSIINSFNPQRIVFGGGISYALPQLIEQAEPLIRQRALSVAVSELKLQHALLGKHAGAIGAASAALQIESNLTHSSSR